MVENEDLLNLKSTSIDPNELKSVWYDVETKKPISIGRGTKKFTGSHNFSFYFIKDPKATLLSQPDDPNFCLGHASFVYGKEKQKVMFFSYGPSARVLDAVLVQLDAAYHTDVIEWHSFKKLEYISNKVSAAQTDFVKNKEEANKQLKKSIDVLFEGFAKIREAEGKPAPKIFKKHKDDLIDKINKPSNNLKEYLDANHYNPFAFKSATTKQVLGENFYRYLSPAEILTQRLTQTNTSAPKLATACGFDISTVYNHLRGTRDVSRDAALRYAKYFNCDPADILFPPIKIPLTGSVDLIKNNSRIEINYNKSETVLCPRDFYSNAREIKSIKIKSASSVYNNHVAYYYFTNKKEEDCENKICFVGVNEKDEFEGEDYTVYYIAIYENYRGTTKLLNADPYRNKEVLVENPDIKFITPIIAFVNIDKVKFAPIVDVKLKNVADDEKLKKLEKELELAEDHFWLQNQKLGGIASLTPSNKKKLDKLHIELREQRLKVDALRRKIANQEFEKTFDEKEFNQRMEELFTPVFNNVEKKKA